MRIRMLSRLSFSRSLSRSLSLSLSTGTALACLVALAVGLVAPDVARATTVSFRSDAAGSTGFDNTSLMLTPTHTIAFADWMSAGAMPGLAIEIAEVQCLRLQSDPIGTCNMSLPLGAGPFASDVTWNLTNNSGLSGPALLFFSGVAMFDPSVSASYDPTQIRIIVDPAVAKVVQYSVGSTDYFYLGFEIADFSQPVTFTYEVDAQQLAGGTPKLLVNSAFNVVPEPSTSLLLTFGLGGLSWLGRARRSA